MLQIKMEPQYHGLFRFHFKAKQPHIDYRGLKGGALSGPFIST